MDEPLQLTCLGHGYTAQRWSRCWLERGESVAGTTRDAARAGGMAGQGVTPVGYEVGGDSAILRSILADTTHLLVSVPPRAGDPDAGGEEPDAGCPLLDALGDAIRSMPRVQWIGYLSTTGVYGDRDGGWVDEDSACAPTSERARRRLAAERAWRALADEGLPVHVFRLAGIYGPGRSVFTQVRSGSARRIDRPEQVFSRIHVDDIGRVLDASIAAPYPGRIYNVCDDRPAAPADVVLHACRLLNVEPPPLTGFEAAELSPMARTFWRDNKRVSNRRMHEELGVSLAFPDYETGLEAILAEETRP